MLKDYHQIARIFRVRAKQPGEKGDSLNLPCNIEHAQPVKAGYIVIGDVCAFCLSFDIVIGRVLQFIRYDRNGKQLGYRGNYADVNENIGVMFIIIIIIIETNSWLIDVLTTYYYGP